MALVVLRPGDRVLASVGDPDNPNHWGSYRIGEVVDDGGDGLVGITWSGEVSADVLADVAVQAAEEAVLVG